MRRSVFLSRVVTASNLHWTEQVWPNGGSPSPFTFTPTRWSTEHYVWLKLTACPTPLTVYSKGRVYDGFRRQAWVVGCSKRWCESCNQERKERKRAKWAGRLREMINWWSAEGGRVVFKTLTVHDNQYPNGHEQLREWLQRLLKRLRADRRGFDFKYWAITEEGTQTGRLHAHLFFFLPKSQEFRIINDVIDVYWEAAHDAYISHYRPVDSGKAAAGYATKYATKAIGLRVLSSKFGWDGFMKRRRSEWLGLEGGVKGVSRWVVVDETERNRTLQGASRLSPAELSSTVTDFTVIANVVCATPTLSPLNQVEGGLKVCGVKGERIGMLTMSGSRRLLPETCILSDSSPFARARRLQVYAAASQLHRTLLTTSNPPDL